MIKFVSFLKRREDMTFEQFVDRYENYHAILGRDHLWNALHYERRYLRPTGHPFEGGAAEAYDCITEIWFEHEVAMQAAFAHLAEPEIAKLFAEDELKIFDRTRTLCFIVDKECGAESGK